MNNLNNIINTILTEASNKHLKQNNAKRSDVLIYKEKESSCSKIIELCNLSDDDYIDGYRKIQNIDNSLICSDIQKTIAYAAINDKHELYKLKYALSAINEQLENNDINYSEASEILDMSMDIFHQHSEEIYYNLLDKIEDYESTFNEPDDSSELNTTINDCLDDIQNMRELLNQYSDNISKLLKNYEDEVNTPLLENVIINMIQLNNDNLPDHNMENIGNYLKAFKTISIRMRRSLNFPKAIMNIVEENDIIIVPDDTKLHQYQDALCTVISIGDIDNMDNTDFGDIIIDYASSFFEREIASIYEKFGNHPSQSIIRIG